MSEPEIPRDCLEQAAVWHARLKSPAITDADREACRQWREADPRHALALAEVERIDRLMTMLAATGPDRAVPEALPAPPEVTSAPAANAADLPAAADGTAAPGGAGGAGSTTRRLAAVAAAACLAIVALGVWRFGPADPSEQTMIHANDGRIVQHLTLADGSRVDLDAGSRLTVRYSASERTLELSSGRASFDVRKDPSRPFAVTAAGSRTVALGTQFQVENVARQVVVTLQEGSVAVSARGADGSWSERLVPGDQLRLSLESGAHERLAVDVNRAWSWTTGRLSFHDTPLAEVVGEINRYAEPKLRIGDASIASLKVGGNFIAGNSAGVAAALVTLLPVQVEAAGDGELVLRARAPSGAR